MMIPELPAAALGGDGPAVPGTDLDDLPAPVAGEAADRELAGLVAPVAAAAAGAAAWALPARYAAVAAIGAGWGLVLQTRRPDLYHAAGLGPAAVNARLNLAEAAR